MHSISLTVWYALPTLRIVGIRVSLPILMTVWKHAGINVGINIIVGFPFERAQDILDSINLIKELDVATNINTFTPYPGSELYDECIRLGLIRGGVDWLTVSQHSEYNAFVFEISEAHYRELLEKMVHVADSIKQKSPSSSKNIIGAYFRRLGEIWREEEGRPVSFMGTVARKAADKLMWTEKNSKRQ